MHQLQLQFLLLVFAGWVNRRQQYVIEYLHEENRVLREQLGGRRIRFTDVQRRRLAECAKRVGRRGLFEVATLVTPDTLLRWYRTFTVEVVTWRGLVRYFVLFVIDFQTRRVEIAGISRSPDGQWIMQLARNLTDAESGFLRSALYLIHDRDPLFTNEFAKRREISGVRPLKLPARSPNLNAYAERFVRSIKSECLAQIIPLGERHLRHAVRAHTEHYHLERNHQVVPLHGNTVQRDEVHQQGLENELIDPCSSDFRGDGPVVSRERLGGMLRYYRRAT